MNISLVLPISILIGFTALMKHLQKSWLAPGTFFAVLWTFFVVTPIVFAPSYPVFPFGIWVITIFVFAVSMGSVLANQFQNKINIQIEDESISIIHRFLFLATFILTIISSMGLIFLFFFGVSRFNLSNSIIDFLVLPNQFSMDRYHGAVVIPQTVRLMMYLLYPASLMGGIAFINVSKKWQKIFLIIPIVLSIGFAFLLTTRSTILLSVILWSSGLFTSKIFHHDGKTKILKFQSLIILIFTFAGFTGIFILTAWLRDAGGEIFIDAMIDNVSAYFFGYLSSFTQWIQVYNQKNILFGMVTFAGPADLLGLTERELGFYNEVSVLGESHTNIFTALRGIIHDFSIIGGFLYFGIFGFIGTMAYNACFNKRILWIIPLSIFYAFTIYSPLISIFNYNSILFSWIILGFTIIISPIFKRYMI